MSSFFTLDFKNQLGIAIMAAALLALTTFFIIVLIKVIRPKKIDKNGIEFSEEQNEKIPSIMHHRLFKFFESSEAPGALSLDGNSDKSILCENYLKLKFSVLYENYVIFFKSLEKRDFEGLSKLPNSVNEWIEEYEKKSDKMITHTSKGDICGVPACFKQKFSRWHRRHAVQLFDDYENALADRIYVNNRERAFAMANATFYALRETIQDAIYTLDNLNGDLEREINAMIEDQGCKEHSL